MRAIANIYSFQLHECFLEDNDRLALLPTLVDSWNTAQLSCRKATIQSEDGTFAQLSDTNINANILYFDFTVPVFYVKHAHTG